MQNVADIVSDVDRKFPEAINLAIAGPVEATSFYTLQELQLIEGQNKHNNRICMHLPVNTGLFVCLKHLPNRTKSSNLNVAKQWCHFQIPHSQKQRWADSEQKPHQSETQMQTEKKE
jgi:hypothetical protein